MRQHTELSCSLPSTSRQTAWHPSECVRGSTTQYQAHVLGTASMFMLHVHVCRPCRPSRSWCKPCSRGTHWSRTCRSCSRSTLRRPGEAAGQSCSGIMEPSAGRITARRQPTNVHALVTMVFTPAWLLAMHLQQTHASFGDAHACTALAAPLCLRLCRAARRTSCGRCSRRCSRRRTSCGASMRSSSAMSASAAAAGQQALVLQAGPASRPGQLARAAAGSRRHPSTGAHHRW